MNNLKLIHLTETDSTNEYVKRLKNSVGAAGNAPDCEYLVTSETQSAGRGRLGRSFTSKRGGLYCSMSFTPTVEPQNTMHYTSLCAIAVKRALDSSTGASFDIKWPNDIYMQGKKVCGILTDAVYFGDKFYIVFGMGINLENELPEDVPDIATVYELTSVKLDPDILAEQIAEELIQILESAPSNMCEYISEYTEACITLGKEVTSGGVTGKALRIDENASLIIQAADGECIKLFSGEATLRG